jgi:ADP-ribose pyrophosphatase
MPQEWKPVQKEQLHHYPVFDLMLETYLSPRTGAPYPFYVLKTLDWVNVIPLTSDNRIVMIRQFRAGIASLTLEIPGGLIDREDKTPLAAARRELKEETGYESNEILYLGKVHPNPAILNNQCYTFLAKDVRLTSEQHLDRGEDIEVILVDADRIPDLIRDGEISHSQVLNAFQWFFQHQYG